MAPTAKRNRISTYTDIDKSLLVGLSNARERSVPLDGNILMDKVEKLSVIYGISPTPSRSWLQGWGRPNGIYFGKQHGQAASADT